ncbi:MAG: hypothetical protein MZV70_43885 [Desulfobacterales bacterium]|nr:hypothetical protein [Desulfobacterales bacterium]
MTGAPPPSSSTACRRKGVGTRRIRHELEKRGLDDHQAEAQLRAERDPGGRAFAGPARSPQETGELLAGRAGFSGQECFGSSDSCATGASRMHS